MALWAKNWKMLAGQKHCKFFTQQQAKNWRNFFTQQQAKNWKIHSCSQQPLVTGREKQPHASSDLNNFEHHLRCQSGVCARPNKEEAAGRLEEEEEDFVQPLSDLDRPSAPGKKSVLGFVQRETCQSVCDQLNKDSDRLREKAAKGSSNRLQRQKKDTPELIFGPQDVDEKIKNFKRCRAENGCSRRVAVEAEAGSQKSEEAFEPT